MGSSVKYDRITAVNRTGDLVSQTGEKPCGCESNSGSLESLCRPRFFAGQLLTEDDFRALDRYIVEKNRLHNRHLHGWGVVSGLDVRCFDCGDGVIVKKGYALSPRGDDIIVADDVKVDVCALISDYKKEVRKGCNSSYGTVNQGCDERQQEWILALCYSEKPSRGVTPLVNARTEKEGCGCNGGSTRSKPQCEPTLTCEGYSFKVYPAPAKVRRIEDRNNSATGAALFDRVKACLAEIQEIIATRPQQATPQQLHDWCCNTKESLLRYLDTRPNYDCEMGRRLSRIVCPSPNLDPKQFNEMFADTQRQLVAVIAEIMFSCICTALQPPVVSDPADDCVPLARITVKGENGCQVASVCNWTSLRKYVISAPSLEYWFSILPIGQMVSQALENFCCSAGGLRIGEPVIDQNYNEKYAADTRSFTAAPDGSVYTKTAAYSHVPDESGSDNMEKDTSWSAANLGFNANTASKINSLLENVVNTFAVHGKSSDLKSFLTTVLSDQDKEGGDYIAKARSEDFTQFVILDQVVKPVLQKIAPLANVAVESPIKPQAESQEMVSIKAEMKELRQIVRMQQETIEKLSDATVKNTKSTEKIDDTKKKSDKK